MQSAGFLRQELNLTAFSANWDQFGQSDWTEITFFYYICLLLKYEPCRAIRCLKICRTRTKPEEAAFSFYAIQIWNKLSENLRCAETDGSFKSEQKTKVFISF